LKKGKPSFWFWLARKIARIPQYVAKSLRESVTMMRNDPIEQMINCGVFSFGSFCIGSIVATLTGNLLFLLPSLVFALLALHGYYRCEMEDC